jgi:hypothetical protein
LIRTGGVERLAHDDRPDGAGNGIRCPGETVQGRERAQAKILGDQVRRNVRFAAHTKTDARRAEEAEPGGMRDGQGKRAYRRNQQQAERDSWRKIAIQQPTRQQTPGQRCASEH